MKIVCADVGGTTVKSALISVGRIRLPQSYRIKKFFCVRTRSDLGFDGVRSSVLEAINAVRCDEAKDIVAVATAGEVDWDVGRVVNATSSLPGFTGYAFAQDLSETLGCRATVLNDACAAAVCEHFFARRRAASTLMLTIGTGLGSALVINGTIDKDHVFDLELGHRTFVEDGRLCRCGKRGCLEQYLSATAVKAEAGTGSVKEAFINTDDEKCVKAKDNFLSVLNRVICDVKKEFAPARIVIGGGLAEMRNLWEAEFRSEYGHEDVRTAAFGNKAGLLGAAYAMLNGRFAAQ